MKQIFSCFKCKNSFEEEIEVAVATQILFNFPKRETDKHEYVFQCRSCSGIETIKPCEGLAVGA